MCTCVWYTLSILLHVHLLRPAGIIKNTLQIEKFWKKEKIFKPKIKKKEIEYIIKKWKKTLALLIKLNL